MSKFRVFKPGDKVRILPDRIESWQRDRELTVEMVRNNSTIRGTGHPQSLTMTNGETYSGWWFDPAAVCHWSRVVSPSPQENTDAG